MATKITTKETAIKKVKATDESGCEKASNTVNIVYNDFNSKCLLTSIGNVATPTEMEQWMGNDGKNTLEFNRIGAEQLIPIITGLTTWYGDRHIVCDDNCNIYGAIIIYKSVDLKCDSQASALLKILCSHLLHASQKAFHISRSTLKESSVMIPSQVCVIEQEVNVDYDTYKTYLKDNCVTPSGDKLDVLIIEFTNATKDAALSQLANNLIRR